MRKFAPLLLLIGAALAAEDPAGWTAAKWGMTADQVRTAVPSDQVRIGATAWRVTYTYKDGCLAAVELRPVEPATVTDVEFLHVEQLLVARYGRPFDRRVTMGEATVHEAMWAMPQTIITLSYKNLGPHTPIETLTLTYRLNSSSPL